MASYKKRQNLSQEPNPQDQPLEQLMNELQPTRPLIKRQAHYLPPARPDINFVDYRIDNFNRNLEALVFEMLCETRGGLGRIGCLELLDRLKLEVNVFIRSRNTKS